MGGRPIGYISDFLFHQRNRFGFFEVRNENVALHIHDLLLTEKTRLMLASRFDRSIGLLPSSDPRENLDRNIVRGYFTLDVCECTVTKGLYSQLQSTPQCYA